jgi:hypothetical protein
MASQSVAVGAPVADGGQTTALLRCCAGIKSATSILEIGRDARAIFDRFAVVILELGVDRQDLLSRLLR